MHGINLKMQTARLLSPDKGDPHKPQSSFPVVYKVGNVVNFVLLHSEG